MPAIARNVGRAILRAVSTLVSTPEAIKITRSHECERCTQECVRYVKSSRPIRTLLSAGILAFVAFSYLVADTHDDVVDLFANMANALSTVNPAKFMDAFDKNMPDYEKLKGQIAALVNQTEVTSSVEPLKDEGDGAKRSVELDWYLEIRSLLPDGPIARRREVIQCELKREGKHWRIVSLKPVEFFAAAKLDR